MYSESSIYRTDKFSISYVKTVPIFLVSPVCIRNKCRITQTGRGWFSKLPNQTQVHLVNTAGTHEKPWEGIGSLGNHEERAGEAGGGLIRKL